MNSEDAKRIVKSLILEAEQKKKEELRQLHGVEFSEVAGKVQHLMASVGTEFKPAAEQMRQLMAEIEMLERQKHYAKASGIEFEETEGTDEYVPVVGPSLDIPDGW